MTVKANNSIVECNPYILKGTPVFTGTRVPVANIEAFIKENRTDDEIMYHYPALSKTQVDFARKVFAN